MAPTQYCFGARKDELRSTGAIRLDRRLGSLIRHYAWRVITEIYRRSKFSGTIKTEILIFVKFHTQFSVLKLIKLLIDSSR
jgi:hypothetical protein